MPSRALRRLQSALSRTQCSPEEFVIRYQHVVAWYSARSIRRWLAGDRIPKAVALTLDTFHASYREPK